MASFIEQATLRVIDQASAPIGKIDGALRRLDKLATGFGSKIISVTVRASNLSQTARDVGTLQRALNRIGTAPATNLSSIVSGLGQVTQAANAATAAIRGMNQASRAAGASAGPAFRSAGRAAANNGWFGRFPENIGPIAARYAGWNAVSTGHNIVRSSGRGIVDAATERTALAMTGVAVPPELLKGKSDAEARAISRSYEAAVKEGVLFGAVNAASKYKTLTEAGMIDVGRTAIPNMKDPTQIASMMETFGETAAALSLVYRDAEKGMEGARQGYRALDQMGVAGDPAKLDSMMKAWATGIFASGRDVSAIQMAQTVSRLGGAKMGLSEDAFARLIMLQDEARGQTANLVRTFQNDMVRPDKSDKMMDRAIASGVRDRAGHAKFGEELQADPQMYILNRIKPLAEKFGYVSQRLDKATGQMVEMSDAEKASQLNKILTDKLGFTSSAKTFVLDTIVKEDEIRRNARTIEAQRAKLTPEALRALVGTDLKVSMQAVEATWKRASDSITNALQPLGARGMGTVASILDRISTNPTGAGLFALGVGGAAIYAANNPHVVALAGAATAHLGAAAALTRAAGALAGGGILSGNMKGKGLGFAPVPTSWTGRAMSLAGKGLMGLGGLAVGYDLLMGNMGNAALGAASLAAAIYSPILGIGAMVAMAADQAFNDGKITGAATGWIDKIFAELFGATKAKAATNKSLNPALEGSAKTLRDLEHELAEKKLRLEHKLPGAQTSAERKAITSEIARLESQRKVQAAIVARNASLELNYAASIEAGNAMMKDPSVDPAQRARLSQAKAAVSNAATKEAAAIVAERLAANPVLTATETMEYRKAQADLLAISERVAKESAEMAKRGGAAGPSWWNPFSWLISPAHGAGRPTSFDDLPVSYGGEPGGLGGGRIADSIAQPLATAGERAATSIGDAGANAGAEIAAAGGTIANGASEAASAIVAAGHAFAGIIGSISIPGASEIGPRGQNTGANPTMR